MRNNIAIMLDTSPQFGISSILVAITGGLVTFVGSLFKDRSIAVRKQRALEIGGQLMKFTIENFDARAKIENPTEAESKTHRTELVEIHNSVYAEFRCPDGGLDLQPSRVPRWVLITRFFFVAVETLLIVLAFGYTVGSHVSGSPDIRPVLGASALGVTTCWLFVEMFLYKLRSRARR
jgi:hypothetical protein